MVRLASLFLAAAIAALVATVAEAQPPASGPTREADPAARSAAAQATGARGTELAKKAQDPGSAIVSFPFQLNFNGGIGPYDRTQLLLNVQPVLPVPLRKDNSIALITRWILPLVGQPDSAGPSGTTWGVGDFEPQLFLAFKVKTLTLGAGAAALAPTATDGTLGHGRLALGPVGLLTFTSGPLVVGALAAQVFSADRNETRDDVSRLTVQAFANYNLAHGAYLVSAPFMRFDFEHDDYTVPIGGGFGKLFAFGETPVNCNAQAFWNAAHPGGGPRWQMRALVQLLFVQPDGG